MSYILEALKKAQAERQLGSAPTIHALPIQAAPAAQGSGARTPWYIAAACVALLIAGGAVAWWRTAAPVAPAVLAVQPAVPAPPPVMIAPAPAPTPTPAPAPPPVVVAQAAPVRVAPPKPPVPVVQAAPPPVAEAAATPEDRLPFMSQLPEPQRSEVPKVVFGGYMYSKNPADRLLLIDKVLRHEGEEVAPGLILEQLQPKAAVMNFRGTRYRVAY
jgi:general secretion pathway protein B